MKTDLEKLLRFLEEQQAKDFSDEEISLVDLMDNYESGVVIKDKAPNRILSYSSQITRGNGFTGSMKKDATGLLDVPSGRPDGNDSNRPREKFEEQDDEVAQRFFGGASDPNQQESLPSANIKRRCDKPINIPDENELDNFFSYLGFENMSKEAENNNLGVKMSNEIREIQKLAKTLSVQGFGAQASRVLGLTKEANQPLGRYDLRTKFDALSAKITSAVQAEGPAGGWDWFLGNEDPPLLAAYVKSYSGHIEDLDSTVRGDSVPFNRQPPRERLRSINRFFRRLSTKTPHDAYVNITTTRGTSTVKCPVTEGVFDEYKTDVKAATGDDKFFDAAPVFWTICAMYALSEMNEFFETLNTIKEQVDAAQSASPSASNAGAWDFDWGEPRDGSVMVAKRDIAGTNLREVWVWDKQMWKNRRTWAQHYKALIGVPHTSSEDPGEKGLVNKEGVDSGFGKDTDKAPWTTYFRQIAPERKKASLDYDLKKIAGLGRPENLRVPGQGGGGNSAIEAEIKRLSMGRVKDQESGDEFRKWMHADSDRKAAATRLDLSPPNKGKGGVVWNNSFMKKALEEWGKKYDDALKAAQSSALESGSQGATSVNKAALRAYLLMDHATRELLKDNLTNRDKLIATFPKDGDQSRTPRFNPGPGEPFGADAIGDVDYMLRHDRLTRDVKQAYDLDNVGGALSVLTQRSAWADRDSALADQRQKLEDEAAAAKAASEARLSDFYIASKGGGARANDTEGYPVEGSIFVRKSDGEIFYLGRNPTSGERQLFKLEDRPRAVGITNSSIKNDPGKIFLSEKEQRAIWSQVPPTQVEAWKNFLDQQYQAFESRTAEGQGVFHQSIEKEYANYDEARQRMYNEGVFARPQARQSGPDRSVGTAGRSGGRSRRDRRREERDASVLKDSRGSFDVKKKSQLTKEAAGKASLSDFYIAPHGGGPQSVSRDSEGYPTEGTIFVRKRDGKVFYMGKNQAGKRQLFKIQDRPRALGITDPQIQANPGKIYLSEAEQESIWTQVPPAQRKSWKRFLDSQYQAFESRTPEGKGFFHQSTEKEFENYDEARKSMRDEGIFERQEQPQAGRRREERDASVMRPVTVQPERQEQPQARRRREERDAAVMRPAQ